MDIPIHDVLLVGGGAAGLRAAIAAAETDSGLNVAVVSKVYPMRSHTVSAEGGAAAVMREYDNLDLHSFDTITGQRLPGRPGRRGSLREGSTGRIHSTRTLGLPLESG